MIRLKANRRKGICATRTPAPGDHNARWNTASYRRWLCLVVALLAIVMGGAIAAMDESAPAFTDGAAPLEVVPAYLHPSNRPRSVSDPYCYAYVAWYANKWFGGAETGISQIIADLKCGGKEGVEVKELVRWLAARGIKASAVKLDSESVKDLDMPFVPIWRGTAASSGHVAICIPRSGDGFVMMDGRHEPAFVSASELTAALDGRWDGSSLLLAKRDFPPPFLAEGIILLTVGGVIVLVSKRRAVKPRQLSQHRPPLKERQAVRSQPRQWANE